MKIKIKFSTQTVNFEYNSWVITQLLLSVETWELMVISILIFQLIVVDNLVETRSARTVNGKYHSWVITQLTLNRNIGYGSILIL